MIGKETLTIGPSLHKALQRLRTPNTTMTVWTDAICINQAHIPEKNVQIQLMTVLYPKAICVVCWLGEDDGTVSTAFALLEQWADASGKDQQALEQSLVKAAQSSIANQDSPEKQALFNLFDRTYFRRAWILQEICVSPSRPPLLVCGEHQLSFNTLSLGFYTLARSLIGYETTMLLGNSVEYVLPMLKLFGFGETRFAVSALIPTVATRKAHNPLDRIYAYCGLFSRDGPSYPAPDYSLTVEEVFTTYTRASIQLEKRLDVLYSVDTRLESDNGMPTWAVKPSNMNKGYSAIEKTDLDRTTANSLRRFAATGQSVLELLQASTEENHILRLAGIPVDNIASTHMLKDLVGRLYVTPRSWQRSMQACSEYLEQAKLGSGHDGADGDLLQKFIDCITCGGFFLTSTLRDHERHLSLQYDRFYAAYLRQRATTSTNAGGAMTQEELMALARKHIDSKATTWPEAGVQSPDSSSTLQWASETAASMLANEVDNATSQRVLATTESGYVVLVHESAQRGDDVCLLLGSTVPFVVRQVEHEQMRYKLISDAYVPGIMYGELFARTRGNVVEYSLI